MSTGRALKTDLPCADRVPSGQPFWWSLRLHALSWWKICIAVLSSMYTQVCLQSTVAVHHEILLNFRGVKSLGERKKLPNIVVTSRPDLCQDAPRCHCAAHPGGGLLSTNILPFSQPCTTFYLIADLGQFCIHASNELRSKSILF